MRPHGLWCVVFDVVRIGKAGSLIGMVSVENVCSVFSVLKAGDLEDRLRNGRNGGDGALDDISGCAKESRRRQVLWID